MIRPCPVAKTCVGTERGSGSDLPYLNLSSESPDTLTYLGMAFFYDIGETPPLGSPWTAMACGVALFTTTAPYDAELQAIIDAIRCAEDYRNPPNPDDPDQSPVVCNNPHFCSVPLVGETSSFLLPPGSVCTPSQAQSDEQAVALCSYLAYKYPLKLTEPPIACFQTPYDEEITVSGGVGPYTFTVSDGSLPPGMTLEQTGPNKAKISGTPGAAGNFIFKVKVNDSSASSLEKTITMKVMGLNSSAASGQIYVPYSSQLSATGGTEPYLFYKVAGAFPTGLAMSLDGLISGIPTVAGDFVATVAIVDVDLNYCEVAVPISIAAWGPELGFHWYQTFSLPAGCGGGGGGAANGTVNSLSPNTGGANCTESWRGDMLYVGPAITIRLYLNISGTHLLAGLNWQASGQFRVNFAGVGSYLYNEHSAIPAYLEFAVPASLPSAPAPIDISITASSNSGPGTPPPLRNSCTNAVNLIKY